jgi:VIT1/CCC1 family predicted Fe2+/Mn2+ transporter
MRSHGADSLTSRLLRRAHETAYVKTFVFGGLDGVCATCAFIASAFGASLSVGNFFVAGVAQVAASSVSMALGEYLSLAAERDGVLAETARERWKVAVNPEGGRREMMAIYQANGVSEKHARIIADALSLYPEYLVEHTLPHELHMLPVSSSEEEHAAAKQAAAMGASFLVCGAIPLAVCALTLTFVTGDQWGGATAAPLSGMVTCSGFVAAALCLFGLGAVRARVADASYCRGGIVMACQGAASALVATGICWVFERFA